MANPKDNIRKRQPGQAVPGQYIVILKDTVDSDSVPAIAEELTKAQKAKPIHIYQWAIKGFSAKMSEAAALAILRDPRVDFVEEDGEVKGKADFVCTSSPTVVNSPQTPAPAHLDRIDQRNLPLSGNFTFDFNGNGVNVYVIDSGIDVRHGEFLNAQGTASRAFIATKPGGVIFDAADDAQFARGRDFNGHGTQVASILAGRTVGVAKRATLYSVRVLNSSNNGTFSSFMSGVDYVFRQHIKPAVANLSLGGAVSFDPSGAFSLEISIRNLIAAGVTCVVAAPNANVDSSTESPGRVDECITVGATDARTDARAGGFGFGPGIDVYAPGGGFLCAAIAEPDNTQPHNRLIGNLSGGTSTSAPLVTGVVAMYLQKFPTAFPADIAAAIRTNSTKDVLTNIPAGTKNRLLFSKFF